MKWYDDWKWIALSMLFWPLGISLIIRKTIKDKKEGRKAGGCAYIAIAFVLFVISAFVIGGVKELNMTPQQKEARTIRKQAEKQKRIATEKKVKLDRYKNNEIILFAERKIKQKLKSPTTAIFSASGLTRVEKLNFTIVNVTGYVDSQNSFGAMIRSTWLVTFKITENDMLLEGITIQ